MKKTIGFITLGVLSIVSAQTLQIWKNNVPIEYDVKTEVDSITFVESSLSSVSSNVLSSSFLSSSSERISSSYLISSSSQMLNSSGIDGVLDDLSLNVAGRVGGFSFDSTGLWQAMDEHSNGGTSQVLSDDGTLNLRGSCNTVNCNGEYDGSAYFRQGEGTLDGSSLNVLFKITDWVSGSANGEYGKAGWSAHAEASLNYFWKIENGNEKKFVEVEVSDVLCIDMEYKNVDRGTGGNPDLRISLLEEDFSVELDKARPFYSTNGHSSAIQPLEAGRTVYKLPISKFIRPSWINTPTSIRYSLQGFQITRLEAPFTSTEAESQAVPMQNTKDGKTRLKVYKISLNDCVAGASSSQQQSSSSIGVSSSSAVMQIAGWFTESMFNSIVPNRNAFYSWSAFKEAYAELIAMQNSSFPSAGSDFADFLAEGTLQQKQHEAAAFFGQIVQETGLGSWNSGLYHIVESCATPYVSGVCKVNYFAFNNATWGNPAAGKYYYGRGPFQLSWNGNYSWFSEAYYGDEDTLRLDPDILQNDAKMAFLASMWYWTKKEYWGSNPTLHDVIINGATYSGRNGFGATTKAINGTIECDAPGNAAATARANYYVAIQQNIFGLTGNDLDQSNLACY